MQDTSRLTSSSSLESTSVPDLKRSISETRRIKVAESDKSILSLAKDVFRGETSASVVAQDIAATATALSALEKLREEASSTSSTPPAAVRILNTEENSLERNDLLIKEIGFYQTLKEKGYQQLSEQLSLNSGYPWDQIKTLTHPILIEQVFHLYSICQNKEISEELTTEIIDFSLYMIKLTLGSSTSTPELENQAIKRMGKLIHLTNTDPRIVLNCIRNTDYEKALADIKSTFRIELGKLLARLNGYYKAHQETQLQPPENALYATIPKAIAQLLITDIGTINIGIIDDLLDAFLSTNHPPLNYEINLSYSLKLIQSSPKLRAEFEKIQHPKSEAMLSNDVIRASVGIPNNKSIYNLDAKKTILAAMLSHLRQAQDGSCFATALAIELLSSHIRFCLNDLKQIIHESKLTRTIGSIQKDIPFMRRIRDENLNKVITVDREGSIILQAQKGAFVWEAPGILAACQAIGITNVSETVQQALSHLATYTGDRQNIEIGSLLNQICLEITQTDPKREEKVGLLFDQACFAFSSQTVHPLLKVWENTIASMAEAQEGGMIKKNILKSVFYALELQLTELKITPSPIIQKYFLELQKALYENISLQYDPTIGSTLSDHRVNKEGGFILYHENKRIDSAEKFNQFILDRFNDVYKKLKSSPATSPEKQRVYENLSTIFNRHVNTPKFLHYTLIKYHPSNRIQDEEKHNYTSLRFTPWITKSGNDSKTVLEVYFSTQNFPHSQLFAKEETAEQRLAKIIQMGQTMPEKDKQAYLSNPHKLTQFRILGLHSSSLMLGNPTLLKAWQQTNSPKEWIDEAVLTPGAAIAEKRIDDVTRLNFLKKIEEEILPLFLSKSQASFYLKLVKSIPSKFSIKNYRQLMLDTFQRLAQTSPANLSKFARLIDTALYQSLEPILKQNLKDSIVYFADTNWSNKNHDLHFCFVVNPGTGKLEMWECYDNGSHLHALDQKYWLHNQDWEIIAFPEELAPDDTTCLE